MLLHPIPADAERSPSGAVLFTFAVVTGDGHRLLSYTSGRDADEAASNAMHEAAEETERMADLEPDDDEWDVELSLAVDDIQKVEGWLGHVEIMPPEGPIYRMDHGRP